MKTKTYNPRAITTMMNYFVVAMIAFFAIFFLAIYSVKAQDQADTRYTSTPDGHYYIVSSGSGSQVNFPVNVGQAPVPLECNVVPAIEGEMNIQTLSDLQKCTGILEVFRPEFFNQLNVACKVQLYLVYSTQDDYRVNDIFLNGYLRSTRVKTDASVLVFRFDHDGLLADIVSRPRDRQVGEYNANRRIDGEYLKEFDQIEKFAQLLIRRYEEYTASR